MGRVSDLGGRLSKAPCGPQWRMFLAVLWASPSYIVRCASVRSGQALMPLCFKLQIDGKKWQALSNSSPNLACRLKNKGRQWPCVWRVCKANMDRAHNESWTTHDGHHFEMSIAHRPSKSCCKPSVLNPYMYCRREP